jgi:hypothetical protein
MKKQILLAAFLFVALAVNAKIWRVNNNPGVVADFSTMALCVANASVLNDDTVHVEGSSINYSGFTLNKRLVIIGNGYFLSGANSNPGLQANTNSCNFTGASILYDSLGSGSVLMGLENFNFQNAGGGTGADNITITRCRIANFNQLGGVTAGNTMIGWSITKCYIAALFGSSNFVMQNWTLTNNVFLGSPVMDNAGNLNNLVRNNVFRAGLSLNNAYFANNIILPTAITLTNTVVKNNTCIGNASAGFTPFVGSNGNVAGIIYTDANIFQGLAGNSTDGQWRLAAGSQAIGTGETLNAVTPDRGAFGTNDPYVLSGIPPVPTIYALTVPVTVASNATTMPITISTKSNN